MREISFSDFKITTELAEDLPEPPEAERERLAKAMNRELEKMAKELFYGGHKPTEWAATTWPPKPKPQPRGLLGWCINLTVC